MYAIKFTFVDFAKSKLQIVAFPLFAVCQLILIFKNSTLFGIYYMYFGAIILSTQPFIQEQTAEVGFVNMLPGTKQSRVVGRYLFGLANIILVTLISIVNLLIYQSVSHSHVMFIWEGLLSGISIALLFCTFQYILFYLLGKMKSQQLASLIMMVPGFLMFFGVNYLIAFLSEKSPITWERILQMRVTLNLFLFVFSALVFIMGIFISTFIVNRRDY